MRTEKTDILIVGEQGRLARALMRVAPDLFPDLTVVSMGRSQLDIRQRKQSRKQIEALRPKLVINTAAITQVDDAQSIKAEAHAVNALGAACVAQACQKCGASLLHISTDYVFDGFKGRPYAVDDAPNPLNVYGSTKYLGERLVHRFMPTATVLRTAWLFEAFDNAFFSNVFAMAKANKQLKGAVDQWGTPTFLPGFAAALLTLAASGLDQPNNLPPIAHLAGAGDATRYDLVSHIAKAYDGLTGQVTQVDEASIKDWANAAERPLDSRLLVGPESIVWVADLLTDWKAGVDQSVDQQMKTASSSEA